ncbi:unknown protein [Microcystis aeruginosa NIES-843]|uniref:Uncharacterized protein n=1 Tax=Microcystis aeruginosa (strain NIES-843 / IAM M-2473) TaxID=449447 RepID=B0JYB3_MICAN|nr:unknown protein [Microcystis aeruginosa NIES-843]
MLSRYSGQRKGRRFWAVSIGCGLRSRVLGDRFRGQTNPIQEAVGRGGCQRNRIIKIGLRK